MVNLLMFEFLHFRVADFIDILLVAVILYELYSLLKGTTALKIFWGIATIFLFYLFASLLHLDLMTKLLSQVMSVGVIALIVVFQPEIRSFLLFLGNRKFFKIINGQLIRKDNPQDFVEDIDSIVRACKRMSGTLTGALIVIARDNPLDEYIKTGEKIDARVSRELIENIFFKNSPLHDGAVIIKNHRIDAARCILPVSRTEDISSDLGLRHRSAIGISTMTDALVIVVSEQTGYISVCDEGKLSRNVSPLVLKQILTEDFLVIEKTKGSDK
ncbi:MAG: diadenylate cyclase CdaA [Bacteroidales bacterium]|jgi:uncharacterized protein (TIGR00159 family)|nr:diadenylate cyclase CdaA [Bacteroidales bacterium]